MKKRLFTVFLLTVLLTGCFAPKESELPCEWCEATPAYEYKDFVLCKDCNEIYKELTKVAKAEQ